MKLAPDYVSHPVTGVYAGNGIILTIHVWQSPEQGVGQRRKGWGSAGGGGAAQEGVGQRRRGWGSAGGVGQRRRGGAAQEGVGQRRKGWGSAGGGGAAQEGGSTGGGGNIHSGAYLVSILSC